MELREKLSRGEPVYGMMLSEIYVPNVIWMLSRCGFEFILVDCEHGYFDKAHVANLASVALGAGVPLLVRVAELSKTDIPQYLDMGAGGILLANTSGEDEASELVELCRYAPLGGRGVSTFRAHTRYQGGDTARVMQSANERVFVLCQIESEEAARDARAILSVPGVDGALVGPNDMSQRMGIFGQHTHPRMLDALAGVQEAARAAGKFSGVITGNEALIAECKRMGMRWFSVGSELNYLVSGGREAIEGARRV